MSIMVKSAGERNLCGAFFTINNNDKRTCRFSFVRYCRVEILLLLLTPYGPNGCSRIGGARLFSTTKKKKQ